VAATRGSHIALSTDYSCRADLRTCFHGPRHTEARATLAQYLALESTRTRTTCPTTTPRFRDFTCGSKGAAQGRNADLVNSTDSI